MGDGVFEGANIPTQKLYSEFGNPASTVVGTSGSAVVRWDPLTASACSLPSLRNGSATINGAKKKSTRSASTSISASGAPLLGTCTAWKPAARRNTSLAKCEKFPAPGGVVHQSGPRLRGRDEVGQVLVPLRRRDRENRRHVAERDDGREVAQGIEWQGAGRGPADRRRG